MIEKLYALDFPPGYLHTGTVYQSRGRWHAGNCVRFHQGNVQPVGGWQARTPTGDTLTGQPNAAVSWVGDDGFGYIAIGTTLGLFVTRTGGAMYDITPTTTAQTAPQPWRWQLTVFGNVLIAVLSNLSPSDYDPNIYAWTSGDITAAAVTTNTTDGPANVYGIVTTPERFLVALRGRIDGTADGYSRCTVFWASQETYTDWDEADDTNTAGSFPLSTEGAPVCGRPSRGQTLLWTTADLWAMTYIGGDLLFRFDRVGNYCGAVGPQAVVMVDTAAYWMGNGKFFRYDGFVQTLACEVDEFVFGSGVNESSRDLTTAIVNPQFNEVTWYYCGPNATAPDRYVTYNYLESHWVYGVLGRCAGVSFEPLYENRGPVLFDADGVGYDHEFGNDRDGQTVYAESGPMEVGDGDTVQRIQRIVPDDKTLGDVTASLYTALAPDDAEVLHGPYTLTSQTSVRLTARQVRLRLTEAAASAWRVGVVRLGAIAGGRR